jgi:uncharacterized protein (TIGR03437 family)
MRNVLCVLCAVLVTNAPLLAQVTPLTINGYPTREFGQPTLQSPPVSAAPNLVEGRELFSPSAIAFDNSVSPPHVYIVDNANNRVLGWNNANNVTQGNFADLVIGQPDFYSTFSGGPGTSSSTGLKAPTGIAVDASGNVYVSDSGNNRILRYKTPFKEQAGDLPVDLVIGQKTSSSGSSSNQGQTNPSATSLDLYVGSNVTGLIFPAGLTIDGNGTLWVADVGNNRVLGFPSSSLTANTSLPAANVVLGQNSFISNTLPQSSQFTQTNLSFLYQPVSVAADAQGNLYVADQAGRVIQYLSTSLVIGATGSKVLGIPPTPTSGVAAYPTASTLGSVNSNGGITGSPEGVFVLNGAQGVSVFVCDSPQNRVVRYDTFSGTWTVASGANSPTQNGVTGQPSETTGQVNQGQVNPSNQTFSSPVGGAINPSNGEMWIVDQQNNRVVAFANQGGGVYSTASRVIGQTDFIYGTPNLIVGSELFINGGGGVAIDSTSNPPHLYVADTLNNRVLGFKNAYSVGIGSGVLTQKADLVIGQADLLHSTINSPNGQSGQPSATGLYEPVGVAVDANGNLWVADSGNGRAVRFPSPFAQAAGSVQTATVVLGQPDLVTYNTGVSQFSMTQPYGLALFAGGGALGSSSLAVSDPGANRILIFNRASGGDFTSGEPAQFVVGQTSFSGSVGGSGSSQLNGPRHVAVDSSDRLYVADYNNNRLVVFSKPTANTPSATLTVPISQPQGVIVSFLTGLSWVTSGNTVYQLPEFNTLQITDQYTQTIGSYGPLAVALDPFDNLIVADSANRLTFYFGQLFYRNTASYAAGVGLSAGPAPGMLVEIGLENSSFKLTPSYTGTPQNLPTPWPTTLNNIQVTVNGFPAPIFRMDTNVISFEIPNEAPQSGPAQFIVTNTATGQVLAVNTGVYNMQPTSPGIYTTNSGGTGQVAANVYTSAGVCVGNCINGPSNPVLPGGIIGLWLTGAGYVPNLPPDGTAPGGNQFPQFSPIVFINGEVATVVGSQISPQFPGVWQINVVVPADTPASTLQNISVVVELDDYFSNIGAGPSTYPNGSPGPDQALTLANGLITTIYVK